MQHFASMAIGTATLQGVVAVSLLVSGPSIHSRLLEMKFILVFLFAVAEADYFILEMDKPDINKASLVPQALTDIITCSDKCEKDPDCKGVNIDLKNLEPCKVVTEAAANEGDARMMRGQLIESPVCESTIPEAETTSQTTTQPPPQ